MYSLMVNTKEVMAPSQHDGKIVYWDVKTQYKETKSIRLNFMRNKMTSF